jgi:outer membrane protein OmpA-like peptidoglycan-associated protein
MASAMKPPTAAGVLAFLAMALLGACGPKTLVVLVPDPDGAVGAVTVSNTAGAVKLDSANQATTSKSPEAPPAAPERLNEAKIQSLFADALAIAPPLPLHFLLYFQSDSIRLTDDSEKRLPEILSAIEERNAMIISVVGHSDTLGDKTYNLALSRRRAQAVQQRLVRMGVDPSAIETTSHGEENPLIKTPDNVSQPQNRRVEVIVR